MSFATLSTPVVYMFIATTAVILLIQDWRLILISLGIQYAGVFVLVGISWPLEMTIIKFITGLFVTMILWVELYRLPVEASVYSVRGEEVLRISDRLFRILMAILIGLVVVSLGAEVAKWFLSASYSQIMGSLFLSGMGIIILGMTSQPFKVLVGLLTFLSGFEILFSTFETSSLMVWFLAFIHLGVALIGAYVIESMHVSIEK